MTKETTQTVYSWGEDTLVYMAKRLLRLPSDSVFECWATTDDPRGFVSVLKPADAIHLVHAGEKSAEITQLTVFCTHFAFQIPGLLLVLVEPMEKDICITLYDLETYVLYRSVTFKPEAEIIPFLVEVAAERRKEKSL